MTPFHLLRPALALILLSSLTSLPVANSDAERVEQSPFSGKAVPRFGTLRYSAVNGRQGPSLQHQILWRYEQAGLPVLVIRETHNWVRVRDALGDEVWMQTRMLEDTRNLLVKKDTLLRRGPSTDSNATAHLKDGLIVGYRGCEAGWCAVQVGRQTGFVEQDRVWGSELELTLQVRTVAADTGVAP